jgi:hypothetical protein
MIMKKLFAATAISAFLCTSVAQAQQATFPTTSGASIATPVSVPNGGSGNASLAVGALNTGNGTGAYVPLADVATGSCLTSGGVGIMPGWGSCGTGSGATLGANTFTGQQIYSGAAAASAPNLLQTGAPYTGGTGTTTWPLWLEQPTGTISTTWSTNGTMFGVNTPSGFVGNLFDFQSAGTSRASLTAGGTLTATNVNAANSLQLNGVTYSIKTAPTITSGFGTSPTVPLNVGTLVFTVNVGTGGTASSGVITMPAAPHGWACQADDITNNASSSTAESATTTTGVTLTNYSRTTGVATAWAASDIVQVSCLEY